MHMKVLYYQQLSSTKCKIKRLEAYSNINGLNAYA